MASEASSAIGAVLGWRAATLTPDTGAGRAASARLCRAGSVFDALLIAETLDLIRRARQATKKPGGADWEQRLVVLAMTLASVKGDGKTSLAAALGQTPAGKAPSGEERPRWSPARFAALTRAARARDWNAFARQLRRASAVLKDVAVDAPAFVGDLLYLNDATLRRWTYQYWQTREPREGDSETLSEAMD